jgi:2'-5' RNA ligase
MISEYASLNSDEFICDQVFLFKSDLQPSGAVYSKLKQTGMGMTNAE